MGKRDGREIGGWEDKVRAINKGIIGCKVLPCSLYKGENEHGNEGPLN